MLLLLLRPSLDRGDAEDAEEPLEVLLSALRVSAVNALSEQKYSRSSGLIPGAGYQLLLSLPRLRRTAAAPAATAARAMPATRRPTGSGTDGGMETVPVSSATAGWRT